MHAPGNATANNIMYMYHATTEKSKTSVLQYIWNGMVLISLVPMTGNKNPTLPLPS
jgi:hypothetical protein